MSKYTCGFEQRLQRPVWVRKTKHSRAGEEDVGYSYVVIRRGARPPRVNTKVGRTGEVGRRLSDKSSDKLPTEITELVVEEVSASITSDGQHTSNEDPHADFSEEPDRLPEEDTAPETLPAREKIDVSLRQEAYSWSRLIFPPLKNGGHNILDGCTAEGCVLVNLFDFSDRSSHCNRQDNASGRTQVTGEAAIL